MRQLIPALIIVCLIITGKPTFGLQTSANDLKIVFLSDRSGKNDAYSTDTNGISVTPLISNVDDLVSISCSPDGRYLLSNSIKGDIFVTDVVNLSTVTLFSHSSKDYQDPTWSPDGTQIAFNLRKDGNSDIYVANSDGSNVARITHAMGVDRLPSWSPDGTRIAFASERDNLPGIFVINADGSGEVRLTSNPIIDTFPSWSPDGSKIAFTMFGEETADIYTINPDGTNLTRLTGPYQDSNWEPLWSPDGNKILFTSFRDGNSEVYIMDADGSNALRLTNNPALDEGRCWLKNMNSAQISFPILYYLSSLSPK